MKSLFSEYSYKGMAKMFINQFAISIFGAGLAMATTAAGNTVLTVVVSGFAILFYLFLIYVMTWELGAADRLAVDLGKKQARPHLGLVLSLFANIPNFLIAIAYTVGFPFMARQEWAGSLCAVVKLLVVIFEGMYLGLITALSIGGQQLNYYWWTYFLLTVPALATAWVAYYFGYRNFKCTTLFDYKAPSQGKKKD